MNENDTPKLSAKELLVPLKDVAMDYAELGIDAISNDGILKEIPLIRSVAAFFALGNKIHDKHVERQIHRFLVALNANEIPAEKLAAHRQRFDDNPKQAEKELHLVLITLDRSTEEEKAVFYGKLYRAYLMGKVDFDRFSELVEVVNRLFLQDVHILQHLRFNPAIGVRAESYQFSRLISIGLCATSESQLRQSTAILGGGYHLTILGKTLIDLIGQYDLL